MTTWGIHNDRLGDQLYREGFISIGWDEIGDLDAIGDDRDKLKQILADSIADAKPGAIPVWAGILHRFAFDMRPGDRVISPYKADGTLNFGLVDGPYEFHPEVDEHRHRRRIKWVKTGVPRGIFPQSALYEIGAAMTLFKVSKHASVFAPYFTPDAKVDAPEDAVVVPLRDDHATHHVDEWAAEEPNAEKLDQYTRDVVLRTLLTDLTHEEFEQFTADLLRAMGYQARTTPYVADGGIDVIAHRDPLGLEPPMIKVQCKHSVAQRSRPDVQALIGTLSQGELGLFVSLGAYSSDALALERERQALRLLSGQDVVDLVLKYYTGLAPEWRARIPLRQVYVIDRVGEGRG